MASFLKPPTRLARAATLLGTLIAVSGCAWLQPTAADEPAPAPGPLDCPLSTNCVNSLGADGLAPLRYTGGRAKGMAVLQATLRQFPEARVVRASDTVVETLFTTSMGFVEEVEFRFVPEASRIDFRSRSKIGVYDFNSNRSRMQAFAARFAAQLASTPAR